MAQKLTTTLRARRKCRIDCSHGISSVVMAGKTNFTCFLSCRHLHYLTILKLQPFFAQTSEPRHISMHQITTSIANTCLRLLQAKFEAFMDDPANGFDENEKAQVLAAFPADWADLAPTYATLQHDSASDPDRRLPAQDDSFTYPLHDPSLTNATRTQDAAGDVSQVLQARLASVLTPRARPTNKPSSEPRNQRYE